MFLRCGYNRLIFLKVTRGVKQGQSKKGIKFVDDLFFCPSAKKILSVLIEVFENSIRAVNVVLSGIKLTLLKTL